MKNHDAKVAEICGYGSTFGNAAIPGLLVFVCESLEYRHLAVRRDALFNHTCGDVSGHQVVWTGQEDDIAASVFQVVNQLFKCRFNTVTFMESNKDHIF